MDTATGLALSALAITVTVTPARADTFPVGTYSLNYTSCAVDHLEGYTGQGSLYYYSNYYTGGYVQGRYWKSFYTQFFRGGAWENSGYYYRWC
ncbi:hypothetical protein [Microbispora sp. H10670]|uniref:hypothetical protein n=1 Tax=Microbispora sp. H10670 TaxID=2729108 RepID=UPI001602C84B|nr:hypothetical protein [Microbispora sp. H10670]